MRSRLMLRAAVTLGLALTASAAFGGTKLDKKGAAGGSSAGGGSSTLFALTHYKTK